MFINSEGKRIFLTLFLIYNLLIFRKLIIIKIRKFWTDIRIRSIWISTEDFRITTGFDEVPNLYRTCIKLVPYMYQTCTVHASNWYRICIKLVPYMHQTGIIYVLNWYQTIIVHVSNLYHTCMVRSFQLNMYQNCCTHAHYAHRYIIEHSNYIKILSTNSYTANPNIRSEFANFNYYY